MSLLIIELVIFKGTFVVCEQFATILYYKWWYLNLSIQKPHATSTVGTKIGYRVFNKIQELKKLEKRAKFTKEHRRIKGLKM